ncbi:MAG TPA: transglutaminase N-terminal domain-containing protein, partial [Rubrivivax sp.]|nr:transglutaminase N-terminal domain-containing protein [Rubrivivax sp.]
MLFHARPGQRPAGLNEGRCVQPVELKVTHETRYDYSAPVSLAHHLAHLKPLSDAHQQLLSFDLETDPPPGHSRDGQD